MSPPTLTAANTAPIPPASSPTLRTRNTVWTAWIPFSARLPRAPKQPSLRRYGSPTTKRTPSAISRLMLRRSAVAGRGVSGTSIDLRKSAETRYEHASTSRPATDPKTWEIRPATPGPATSAADSPLRNLTFASSRSALSTSEGTIAE